VRNINTLDTGRIWGDVVNLGLRYIESARASLYIQILIVLISTSSLVLSDRLAILFINSGRISLLLGVETYLDKLIDTLYTLYQQQQNIASVSFTGSLAIY